MKKLVFAFAVLLVACPAGAAHIECIHAGSVVADAGGTGVDLSATGAEVPNQTVTVNVAIYSDVEAVNAPAACGGTTCAGFDTASVELWYRCDDNSPWDQIERTATYTAPVKIGRGLFGGCTIRARLITPGDACIYFAVTGAGFKSDQEVQDGAGGGKFVTNLD